MPRPEKARYRVSGRQAPSPLVLSRPLQGITRVRSATDAVGIVLKELKRQSSLGTFHLLVAVDGVNALWGRTTLKREDKSPVGKLSFSLLGPLVSGAVTYAAGTH